MRYRNPLLPGYFESLLKNQLGVEQTAADATSFFSSSPESDASLEPDLSGLVTGDDLNGFMGSPSFYRPPLEEYGSPLAVYSLPLNAYDPFHAPLGGGHPEPDPFSLDQLLGF